MLKSFVRKIRSVMLGSSISSLQQLGDLSLISTWKKMQSESSNPLNQFGAKYFSQNDEDGILIEILRRIGLDRGTFAEFGVGDGTENNTLILLASGWSGFWVGGEKLVFDHELCPNHFSFLERWIDRDNVTSRFREGLNLLKSDDIDVLSLDLDGNDIYLVEELLLNNVNPKLFIVEYNAKFPPPIKWQIEYDSHHCWKHDDYFGASLSSFNELFNKNNYTLICCNITGANAFFIRNDFLSHFDDTPRDLMSIYFPPMYYLFQSSGHKPSAKTIEQMLKLSTPCNYGDYITN